MSIKNSVNNSDSNVDISNILNNSNSNDTFSDNLFKKLYKNIINNNKNPTYPLQKLTLDFEFELYREFNNLKQDKNNNNIHHHHHRSGTNKGSGGFFFRGSAKCSFHVYLSLAHLRIIPASSAVVSSSRRR